MSGEPKTLFTAGQFAKLHNINKRTLHYYDDVGLFSPAVKRENGYRYYTYLQSPTLEMLLTLRELDMSIEEIQRYMRNQSSGALITLLQTKTAEIDASIKRLKQIRKLLTEKENQLLLPQQTDLNGIEIVQCKEEYLLLSRAGTGAFDEQDMALLIAHTQELRQHRMFNYSYGSMVPMEKAMQQDFSEECFFTKLEKPVKKSGLFTKPQGDYIRAFCVGDWDKLPAAYRRISAFAEAHGLKLVGNAYEEGINEMAITRIEDYITQITVRCE